MGILVIALDTPTDPASGVDALFATNNFTAGVLIGKYVRAFDGKKASSAKIATLDLSRPASPSAFSATTDF